MIAKHRNWLLALLLPVLMFSLVLGTGCDALDPDDDEDDYTSPPSELLGEWYLFAGTNEGDSEMYDLSFLEIGVELYVNSESATRFRMDVDGDISEGAIDWRTSSRNEYLVFIEDGDETEIQVLSRSEELIQLMVPNDEGEDQLWVMAKGNFMVAGLVTDIATSLPIAGASITVYDEEESVIFNGITADLGVFLATDLDAGDLMIEFEKDGYRTETESFSIDYDRPVFVMCPMYTGGGSSEEGWIAGLVTDSANGQPLAGATVQTVDGEVRTTTDSNGSYSLTVDAGTFTIVASMTGYADYQEQVNVTAGNTATVDFELQPGSTGGEGTVTGMVTASQSGDPLEGVSISVVGGTATTTTDASGEYTLIVPAGIQQLSASFTGYYALTADLFITADEDHTQNFSLSPIISAGSGGMRMVLSWGESPSDLDSHLLTPEIDGSEYHVYFGNRGDSLDVPYARLDVDDTSGYGPETITIYEAQPGTYRYYIYNWSGTPDIAGCGAQVQMYNEDGLIQTVTVPASGEGDYWYVCDIDGTDGSVTLVNEIRDTTPDFSPGTAAYKAR
ncbi:carboxypeptidase regulatory-like domain-containing protein [bacterium]|nr:carboxypeptidase regulatory-like domain-containing protein [bacterium]